jgi:Leucine Rich repeat
VVLRAAVCATGGSVARAVSRFDIPGDEESLYLDWQEVGPEDATLLTEELATNTSLKELRLSGQRFGDDGAIAIASVLSNESIKLSTNKTLKKLFLYRSEIADGGMAALGQALTRNYSLEALGVRENPVWYSRLDSTRRWLEEQHGVEESVAGRQFH